MAAAEMGHEQSVRALLHAGVYMVPTAREYEIRGLDEQADGRGLRYLSTCPEVSATCSQTSTSTCPLTYLSTCLK